MQARDMLKLFIDLCVCVDVDMGDQRGMGACSMARIGNGSFDGTRLVTKRNKEFGIQLGMEKVTLGIRIGQGLKRG